VVVVVAFKKYDQHQTFILPFNLEDFVPSESPARTINEVVDSLDFSVFLDRYNRRGPSPYDPRMMLKVLFYAYYNGVYSSRVIASRLLSDTVYMYLAGMQKPDFHTLCRFRTMHREGIEQAFLDIVRLCLGLGMVGLGNVSFDGTRIKANASGKRTKDMEAVDKRIKKLLDESIEIDREEDEVYGEETPFRLPPHLRDPKERKRLIKEKLEELKKAKERLEESGEKNTNLTDPDARLMKTRQGVRPAYNGQIAVDAKDQVIVAARLVEKENDHAQLIPLLESVEVNLGRRPWITTADSGYSSLDNLAYLEKRGLLGLIPDVMFHIEKLGKTKYLPRSVFRYNPELDTYTCPGGKTLTHSGSTLYNGDRLDSYRCSENECKQCPGKAKCTGGKARKVSRNSRDYLYTGMRDRLETRLGETLYKERMSIVEPVFGDMKKNRHFNQFSLRGLEKTSTEFLIVCTVHNLMKIHGYLKNKGKTHGDKTGRTLMKGQTGQKVQGQIV
jgi:transposase